MAWKCAQWKCSTQNTLPNTQKYGFTYGHECFKYQKEGSLGKLLYDIESTCSIYEAWWWVWDRNCRSSTEGKVDRSISNIEDQTARKRR